ncbi:MAG: Flp pilus assembly complex ATPase component TadA [Chloroflexi bacterium]|nr:Flp pilus assembly complex ATPase component TadA [Chloroflexota bacterium]
MAARTGTSFEDRVGLVLQEGGFISAEQLGQAGQISQESGKGLLDTLVDQGMVARETLVTVLSFQLRIPIVDLKHVDLDSEAVRLVPEEYARRNTVLPLGFDSDGSVRVATLTPNNFQLSTELSSITGHQTKFVLALGGGLEQLIQRTYATAAISTPAQPPPAPEAPAPEAPLVVTEPTIDIAAAALGQDISQLPAVQAVEMITLQAVKRNASDIHLVPTPDSSKVLFRMDGELQQVIVIPLTLHENMMSRIKVLSGMDIAERRRPQDGSFNLHFGEKTVDFRVSTIGTTWGEMMVVRILDRSGGLLSLEDVGLESTPLHVWRQLLTLPYGMVLVSGPTGSGKTTTLYASITELVQTRGNIMTIEDPVEYRMEDLNQIEVNRAAGIDFAAGLRSIMRLDPDIILVGEIRDEETAKTAVNAALTGHLVLASIHSNDAASSVVRLLDMGTEPYLVATAMVGALAQRLLRKIDPNCKAATELSVTESMAYEQEMQESAGEFWHGQGCNFCGGTGYSGRTGVFEVLSVSEEIRRLISQGASGGQIRKQAMSEGLVPLRRSGIMKAKDGTTTMGEVLRKVFFLE